MSDETQPIGAGVAEEVDRDGAFPRLDERQRARLRELGRVRTVEAVRLVNRRPFAPVDGQVHR